jgi:hypothetical protein
METSPYRKDYSQTIALLEVEGEAEIGSVLNEVHELSKAHHPLPLMLPICLLEKHIEGSVQHFTDIARRVAQVERELYQDMIILPSSGKNDNRMAKYQRFNETLHQCSGPRNTPQIREGAERPPPKEYLNNHRKLSKGKAAAILHGSETEVGSVLQHGCEP